MGSRKKVDSPIDEERVFDLISNGESLNKIAQSLGMAESTLRYWANQTPERVARYARAREMRAHRFAERIHELAEATVAGDVRPEAARVAIDALKWQVSKMLPKVYGERQQIDVDATVRTARQMTEDELMAIIEQGQNK